MRRAMRAEIVIRGAGPAGCVLALLLQQAGRPVVLQRQREASPGTPRAAFRPLALSHASRLILERVGAWRALAPTPITTIHVSQQGGFGRTRMTAADAGVPALGHVLDYGSLQDALLSLVAERNVPAEDAPADGPLTVHA